MPSDERIGQALEVLSAQTQAFKSALAVTADQLSAFANAQGAAKEQKADKIAMELGPFAANLMDPSEFSQYSGETAEANDRALKTAQLAQETLTELAAKEDELFVLDVESGGSLWHSVAKRLGELGRVFAAARAFEHAKSNGTGADKIGTIETLPFSKWSSKERSLAPPLVVTIDGADCHANSLADFLDGTFKILLVLRGESTPAPLVRLMTPGTSVAQATDVAGLKAVAKWDGPGIGAVVTDSAARFVHDPKAGFETADRLKINHLPEGRRRKPLGGVSIWQQAEELLQVQALGKAPEPAATAEEPEVPVNPADKLAAWLLTRADLDDVG